MLTLLLLLHQEGDGVIRGTKLVRITRGSLLLVADRGSGYLAIPTDGRAAFLVSAESEWLELLLDQPGDVDSKLRREW